MKQLTTKQQEIIATHLLSIKHLVHTISVFGKLDRSVSHLPEAVENNLDSVINYLKNCE